MKILLISSFCLFLLMQGQAQEIIKSAAVPQPTKDEFKILYPKVKKVKWFQMDLGFRAEFVENKVKKSVHIDSFGNMLESSTEITKEQLPDSVMIYMNDKYPVAEMSKFTKAEAMSGLTFYEIFAGEKVYVFDEQGVFMRVDAANEH